MKQAHATEADALAALAANHGDSPRFNVYEEDGAWYVGHTPGCNTHPIEAYSMEGADEFLLPERIAAGFQYPVVLEPWQERIIESMKMKDPITGEWKELEWQPPR